MKEINKKYVGIVVLLVVLVGAGSFWGGMTYAKKNTTDFGARGAGANFQGRMGQFGGMNSRGGRTGGGNLFGEIISQDEKSLTVKLQDGGSKIVFLSDQTKVAKSVDGTKADLVTGAGVVVNGIPNPDGSITAQSVQIRPAMPVPVKAE